MQKILSMRFLIALSLLLSLVGGSWVAYDLWRRWKTPNEPIVVQMSPDTQSVDVGAAGWRFIVRKP